MEVFVSFRSRVIFVISRRSGKNVAFLTEIFLT